MTFFFYLFCCWGYLKTAQKNLDEGRMIKGTLFLVLFFFMGAILTYHLNPGMPVLLPLI